MMNLENGSLKERLYRLWGEMEFVSYLLKKEGYLIDAAELLQSADKVMSWCERELLKVRNESETDKQD